MGDAAQKPSAAIFVDYAVKPYAPRAARKARH